MKIPKYILHVRDVLDWPENKVWKLKRPGLVDLTFDDGTVIHNTDTVDLIFSWYYWQVAYVYREIDITPDLFLRGKTLTDGKHRSLMEAAIFPTIEHEDINKEDVWLIAYRDIYNKIYNAIAERLIAYVTSTDVPHILEILFDPEVHEANLKVTDALNTVDRAYAVLRKVFDTKYPNNPICRARNNRTVKEEQLLQSFGPRGRVTDIDSNIYRRPIKRGFAWGFRTINDLCKESRSAAKALLFNKDPVADAEYFNRKLQLVCAVIRRIVKGDCGAHNLHEITVPEGEMGDAILRDLAGLYQELPNGELVAITGKEKELKGTTIRFRSTMTCKHLHQQCVCEICYGLTSYSIPWDSNPGHVSCTAINKRITQLIISTKHLDFIVHKFRATLNNAERIYLATRENYPENLYLNPDREGLNVVLRIRQIDATNLVKVTHYSNLGALVPTEISSLDMVEFYLKEQDGMLGSYEEYDLMKESTRPSLSLPMLQYMKAHGWEITGQYYQVDLAHWDWNKPILVYPLKHDSMSEYADRVERFIRSSNGIGNDDDNKTKQRKTSGKVMMLTKYRNPTDALMDCYYLISEKLAGVHIGHIATVLAASRACDPYRGNYNMPDGLDRGQFAPHDAIITGRSLGPGALFERQSDMFDMTDSYLIKDRHNSIMDDMIYIDPEKYRE